MKMLCASNGTTSSGEIFWLMPAIRRNERRGPGITITLCASGGCTPVSPGGKVPDGAAPQPFDEKQQVHNNIATRKAGGRRGDCMAGVLSEPLRNLQLLMIPGTEDRCRT